MLFRKHISLPRLKESILIHHRGRKGPRHAGTPAKHGQPETVTIGYISRHTGANLSTADTGDLYPLGWALRQRGATPGDVFAVRSTLGLYITQAGWKEVCVCESVCDCLISLVQDLPASHAQPANLPQRNL